MNGIRANSSPNLASPMTTSEQPYDDSALEGVSANMKLLLKLIQDHKDACGRERNDSRRMLRVATMMTILDNVRTRMQKCQSFSHRRSQAGLRRCNTDLRPNQPPKDKKLGGDDEKEKLRRELTASLEARKSLEMMCSSLGKEKEIMAMELSKKVHELDEMEQLIDDLKAQNQRLVEKVQKCGSQHRKMETGESQGILALQERNKVLSELLVGSHDEYRIMKKKLEKAEEEKAMVCGTIGEMGAKIEASLERARRFKDVRLGSGIDFNAQDEIVALEDMFECFKMMVEKHGHKKQGE